MSKLQFITEYYDLNLLNEQVGGNESSLQRFIEIFLETVPVDMEKLGDAIEAKDMEKSRASSHKMKSSYMLMGAEWARDLCYEIETISKTGEETEKLPEIFKELSDKFSKMVILLKS
jgi:HPt (histidine-containing phosphotransfer) domain-containing protein